MRNFLTLSSLLILAACNGSGGGESSTSVTSAGMTSSEALTKFEADFKHLAESLEDEAALRFNPCRDDIKWQSTGPSTGTVEFSGITFTTSNITNVVKSGECDYKFETNDDNGLTYYTFTPTENIPMAGKYTTIQIVNGGMMKLESDVSKNTPMLGISETGAHASFGLVDDNGSMLSKYLYRRLFKANIQSSFSYAIFEVDTDLAEVNFEHRNSEAQEPLSLSIEGHSNFDDDAVASIKGTRLNSIINARYQNNGTNFFYDTKGSVAFIMFDRHLTAGEKDLMSCYALYLTTKTGNSDLWNANFHNVCNL